MDVQNGHVVIGTQKSDGDYYDGIATTKHGAPIAKNPDIRVKCARCGWEGTLRETSGWSPIGGKRWTHHTCPRGADDDDDRCPGHYLAGKHGSRVRDPYNRPWQGVNEDRILDAHIPDECIDDREK